MKFVIVLLALVAVSMARHVQTTSPQPKLLRHEESHDDNGHHIEIEQDDGYLFKEVSKKVVSEDGKVFFRRKGLFHYRPNPDADLVEVTYEADENGYRAQGKHLPKN